MAYENIPANLNEMFNTKEYQEFEASILGNDLWYHDSDRAKRIYNYAEDGMNGSTHEEVINDWREFLEFADYPEKVIEKLLNAIDGCEAWHEKNGSLYTIIG